MNEVPEQISTSDRDLLPTHLRPFYIEGAIVTRYITSHPECPQDWTVELSTVLPWRHVFNYYLRMHSAAIHTEQSGVHPRFGLLDIGDCSVAVAEGKETRILVKPRAFMYGPAPVDVLSPPRIGEPGTVGPSRAAFDTGGLARNNQTRPLTE